MKSDNLFNFSSIPKQLQEICELEDKLFAISDENYEEMYGDDNFVIYKRLSAN